MVTLIRSDLDFILEQIKIAEADAIGVNLVPNSELPWGLRRVDGSNNNLTSGQENYGAADQPFPRTTTPTFLNEGDDGMAFGPPIRDGNGVPIDFGFPGVPPGYIPVDNNLGPGGSDLPANWLSNNDYGVNAANASADPRAIQPGDVVDADPRIISNLIADQTPNNPAAVFKALQDAGLDNATAFVEMGVVATAVQNVKDARAAIDIANALVAQRTAELTDARQALDEAIGAAGAVGLTVVAYNDAIAATNAAISASEAVDQTTSALVTALTAQPLDTADPLVMGALADLLAAAKAAVSTLLAHADAIVAALVSDPSVAPADLRDALDYQTVVSGISTNLSTIDLTDSEVGLLDTNVAAQAELSGNIVGTAAAELLTQLETSLTTISSVSAPDVFTATEVLDAAVLALDAAVTAANDPLLLAADDAAEAALRTLLEGHGVTLEEAPNADILKATVFIGNVAADEGLSAPFNGWMTLFGQFFDHGLDLVAKGGQGTVYIPLQEDDPLYVPGSSTNFMAVTRASLDPETGEPINLTTPFVDQNQTYTSTPSAQVFHREYAWRFDDDLGYDVPVATGRLLNGAGGGLATWADVKAQAANFLGIQLDDHDIHRIPELLVDPYGNFIAGDNGFPQIVTAIDDNGQPVTAGPQIDPETGAILSTVTASDAMATGHAFLDDIAHNANPGTGEQADVDTEVGLTGSNNGFYDNELLDAHYITGDGRGNENIGLTAVHHVFHSEHNRQVGLIQNLLVEEAKAAFTAFNDAPGDLTQQNLADKLDFLNEWLVAPLTAAELADASVDSVQWNGERIFQAAKVPTEMQYQHLVFEEFARKVQPAVNVFNDYDGTINAAILAEFAHTVYRFGHSMLTETVDRLDADWNSIGSNGQVGGDQIGLIEAFLNPLEFAASGLTSDEAAGVIAQGMTRQRGSEIDEFVTEALRNNLVGLPLDLPAINIARGRETGVPTLNEARSEFFAGSGDTQIKPYASWFEFMQNLKNPVSVINFIAAYGTHESIAGQVEDPPGSGTLRDRTAAEKRDAATAIVLGIESNGVAPPADRLDFLHATGTWTPDGVDGADGSLGGLNTVDFWIGGLAEKKLIFGGMLGSTFNFIFETQLEALQNGDRFYYLSRLANLNLTAQLENNKFSEMIHRNTTATHLPGDAFARPDFFLEADISKQYNADLGIGVDPSGTDIGIDPFLGAAAGGGTAGAVLRTDVDNNGIAERLEYTGAEHVVLGGTEGGDHLIGGKGDDAIWGDGGDDTLEGGDGNDFIFGGAGNDIITDLFGVDEIRSGEGDDVVSAGRGLKLIITDTGRDWVWGGVDDDEVLAGQDDDFVSGGDGVDFIIGGEGNDWLESGRENGLMLGDNGDLVQGLPIKRSVDSRIVGHDVLLATGGNADFDAETGDDIMVGGLGTDRFFGQFGFDWATYKNDPFGIEADMNLRLFAPPSLPASPGAILDRYAQTEALSGSAFTDILRGDDIVDLAAGGADVGAIVPGLDHALMDFNVQLITGLDELLGDIDEAGGVRFSAGNILLGGSGSDIIEGRGGNDVIDGDSWLNVRIVRIVDGLEVESHDLMEGYQERVLAGEISVADLHIVREILDTNDENDVDVAEYSGRRADYAVEGINDLDGNILIGDPGFNGFARDLDNDGFITVTHLVRDVDGVVVPGEIGIDGADDLKQIERLLFSDQTIKITDHANTIATGTPTITADGPLAVGTTLTASLAGDIDADGVSGQVVFFWQVELVPGTGVFSNIQSIVADEFAPVTGPAFTLTAAEAGLAVRVLARFKDLPGALETVVSAPLGGVGAPIGDGNVVVGTAGADLLIGTPAVDTLLGLAGNDTLVGLEGDDILNGGSDADTAVFFGQLADFDFLLTPTGTLQVVNILTGEEDDLIDVETIQIVDGSIVNGAIVGTVLDTIDVATLLGGVTIVDTAALNVITGTEFGDRLAGLGGADVIDGLGGDDLIAGNAGADVIDAGGGNDTVSGGNGNNDIRLRRGNETLVVAIGENGTDTVRNDGGIERLSIGEEVVVTTTPVPNVTLVAAPGPIGALDATDDGDGNLAVTIRAAGNTKTVIVTDHFNDPVNNALELINFNGSTLNGVDLGTQDYALFAGTDADDVLTGAATDDALFGSAGADSLIGGDGRDLLFGGNGADTLEGGAAPDILFGEGGQDLLSGGGGADTISGGNGADRISGGNGDDVIDGGAGNDTIIWSAGEGRDLVDGGANGALGDTFVINGGNGAEVFRVYARADAPVGLTLDAGTEIVVTRNTDGEAAIVTDANVIAELRGIEEIVINTGGGADTVIPIGDFSPTSLFSNTITINGSADDDTVDITQLQSDHRIHFVTNGGNDTVVGELRPQDVVEDSDGSTPQDGTPDATGSNSGGSGSSGSGSSSIQDGFAFTPTDIAELKKLVAGIPSAVTEEPQATGVRDLEGTGNNVDNPDYGSADQTFIRLTQARYGEAEPETGNRAINPIFDGLDARQISNILGAQEAGLEKNAYGANTFFMTFGQYFDHGLDFLPKGGNGTIAIGGPGMSMAPGSDNPADLTRGTVAFIDADGIPQHINKTSPFVDQNQAYGSTELVGQFLREGDGDGGLASKLLSGAVDPSNAGFRLLPTLRETILHHWQNDTVFTDEKLPGGSVSFRDYYAGLVDDDGVIDAAMAEGLNADFMASGHTLIGDRNPFINLLDHYIAGDLRANENYTLTSVHTIWARNHNYHVDKLVESGFDGSAEDLFQAAKIVNEAEYQRVVFDEFADAFIGGMRGSGNHGHDAYNPEVDARVSHEFAAAVYRVGHSLVGQTVTILEDGVTKSVPLFDAFLNPTDDSFTTDVGGIYQPQPGFEQIGVDNIIGGIVQQTAEEVDFHVVDAVRNDLVRIRADLFAFNVARGWDVGLGTLNQVRADLLASNDKYVAEAVALSDADLSPYASWEDFQQRNELSDEVLEKFKTAYPDLELGTPEAIAAFVAANPDIELADGNRVRGIDRVDLWVGGLAEKHINGGMVGATFWVVMHEQFDRLQEGDRFYYLDRVGDLEFYETLKELKFSEIVARNTGLTDLPSDIFEARQIDSGDTAGTTGTEAAPTAEEPATTQSETTADETDASTTGTSSQTAGGSTVPGENAASTGTTLLGTAVGDVLIGGSGDDLSVGGGGDDAIVTFGGNDQILAGDGADNVMSGAGDDVVFGDGGNDVIMTDAGNDTVFGGSGADVIMGGAGDDLIDAGSGADRVDAGAGNDTVIANADMEGDVYDGGEGIDTIDLSSATADLTIDLGSSGFGSILSDETGIDALRSFENVMGGSGNDRIIANAAVNVLTGGAGDDSFVFESASAADGDRITDFRSGDLIDLTALAQSLPNGTFSLVESGEFLSGGGQISLHFEQGAEGERTIIEGTLSGQTRDFQIELSGRHNLTTSDFMAVA